MFKKIDHALNRYAPWSYVLLLFAAVAFAMLVKLDLMDGVTGMAINVGLFGLGMSGVLAWSKECEGQLLRESRRHSDQRNREQEQSTGVQQSLVAPDARILLIRFILAVLLMMAATLLFVGLQFLSSRHSILAALALVANIPSESQTLLASASCVIGLVVVILSGRAWWAFEQWLASAKTRSAA